MKKNIQNAAVLTLVSLLAACGGGGGGGGAATQVKGVVTDPLGVPLPGVTVTAGTASATTDAFGAYALNVATPGAVKVVAAKTGMAKTLDVVNVASGQTSMLNLTLTVVGKSNALTNMTANAANADSGRGAVVNLTAGSIVDGSNNPVDSFTVNMTSAVPSDTGYTDKFPGLFVGNVGAGADTPIESFGYVTVDIDCGAGKTCNLLAGKTADIAIPVAAGADPGTATIDLWSLDETTGKWKHEGTANRDATVNPVVYRATVDHFSTYNLDRAIPNAIPFTITVKNDGGAIVPNAQVLITSTNNTGGGTWEGRGTTNAAGTVDFPAVAPGSVSVTASSGNLTGSGYGYDVIDGKGTMTVTLYPTVSKQISVVYVDNGVEKSAPSSTYVNIFAEGGGGGHSFTNPVLNAEGKALLKMRPGLSFYNYNANVTVNGTTYSLNGSVSSLDALPSKWVLVAGGGV